MFATFHGSALVCLASVQFAYWLIWGSTLALSIALVALMWSRWGHSRPLQKCAALSLLVHLMMAFLAMTVRIVAGDGTGGGGGGGGAPIHVRVVQEFGAIGTGNGAPAKTPDVSAPALLAPPAPAERVAERELQGAVAKAIRTEAPAETPVALIAQKTPAEQSKELSPLAKSEDKPRLSEGRKPERS